MTPSELDYTDTPQQTDGSSYFLMEKLPKTVVNKKLLTYVTNTFCEE
jgi:hypothetical protein